MTPTNSPVEYVDNAKLLQALADFKALSEKNLAEGLPEPKIPNYIGECFYSIAENFARINKFNRYTPAWLD